MRIEAWSSKLGKTLVAQFETPSRCHLLFAAFAAGGTPPKMDVLDAATSGGRRRFTTLRGDARRA